MSYYVYILYSGSLDRYYVGYAEDIELRMTWHMSNHKGYTSKAKDWEIVYSEKYQTKGEAMSREREIKRKKSRKYIEWLIERGGDLMP